MMEKLIGVKGARIGSVPPDSGILIVPAQRHGALLDARSSRIDGRQINSLLQ